MNFYVPYARDPDDAEGLWDYLRERLANRGLPTSWRRIRALVCHIEGVDLCVAVGLDVPAAEEGDPVMLIFEASDATDRAYVCTLRQVVKNWKPLGVTLDERWRVIDFDRGGSG